MRVALSFLVMAGLMVQAEAQVIQDKQSQLFVQTADGKPRMCGDEFTVIYQDTLNKQGAIGAVNGSFSLVARADNLSMLLKFTAMDFPDGPSKAPQPFDVASVSITAGQTTIRPSQRIPSDTSRATFFTAFFLPESITILQSLKTGDLKLHFNRHPGDLDYEIPLSLAKGGSDGQSEADYQACVKAVAGQITRAK